MERLIEFWLMRFFPARADIGLLVLRVWIGATLFLRHGWEKRLGQWQHFVTNFPDPVGIGPYASFVVAFAGDFLCALLLVVGLGTRWVALFCFVNIFVAWSLVHHFRLLWQRPRKRPRRVDRSLPGSSADDRHCRRRASGHRFIDGSG